MEKVLYEDVVGVSERPPGPRISDLPVSDSLAKALVAGYGGDIMLSPPQAEAVHQGVVDADAHFLVSAPTNSGKTLIALLRMMEQAVRDGRRSVLVVPLKALAEEKSAELEALAARILEAGGPKVRVRVSTGDYRLSGDFLGSPPPDSGEILICTPERLEVLLRNPDNLSWARSTGTFVLDEFHLLGETGRGAAMEALVTRLLLAVRDSSIVALSATIGGVEQVSGWLGHCGKSVRVIDSAYRFPTLRRRLMRCEDKNALVIERAAQCLARPGASLLIFVYRKSDAEALAESVREALSDTDVVGHFHAGLPLAARQEISGRFRSGQLRVLVATTSLKMGINTPATEVIVRDTLFHGAGRLPTADLLQMLGRAGRGTVGGEGMVLFGPGEEADRYSADFDSGHVAALSPQLMPASAGRRPRRKDPGPSDQDPLSPAVLSEIVATGSANIDQVGTFLSHSFSGWTQSLAAPDLSRTLAHLERGKLVYRVDNAEATFAPTKLGRTTVLTGLSPESGAMLGGFLRALIRLSEKKEEAGDHAPNLLRRIRDLDLLFLAVASFEAREQLVRKSAKKALDRVSTYIEGLDSEEKPLVNLWRSADSADYPTRRLLSSLRFPACSTPAEAEADFNRLMATAILLHRHARGETLDDLAKEYGMHTGSIESGFKYTATWVLGCLAQICTGDRCYKLDFLALRIYELLEDLTMGSTLGKLLTLKGVGRATVEKLLNAGYSDFERLHSLQLSTLSDLGVADDPAGAILRLLRRSQR